MLKIIIKERKKIGFFLYQFSKQAKEEKIHENAFSRFHLRKGVKRKEKLRKKNKKLKNIKKYISKTKYAFI